MGAAHRHAGFEAHQLRQHFGAAHDRQVTVAGLDQLRIVGFDRRGNDHHLGVAEIGGIVADRNGNAALAQARHVVIVGDVRALNLVAKCRHDLGDTAHADAANADEMNGPYAARQFHVGLSLASFSVRSANRCAASGLPCRNAAAAASRNSPS